MSIKVATVSNREHQEDYVDGDNLGTLHCRHDFHSGCIRQWLVVKNLCPICKNTALKTINNNSDVQGLSCGTIVHPIAPSFY